MLSIRVCLMVPSIQIRLTTITHTRKYYVQCAFTRKPYYFYFLFFWRLLHLLLLLFTQSHASWGISATLFCELIVNWILKPQCFYSIIFYFDYQASSGRAKPGSRCVSCVYWVLQNSGNCLILNRKSSHLKMIIPVRCFTCGKVIGNKWEAYLGLLQAEYTEGWV